MKLTSRITDNITELLVKIIEFTRTRQKVLTNNINGLDSPGFIPKDLTAGEFSELLNNALDEHVRTQRLVLCDTKNIKFGIAGSFEVKSIVDEYAKKILEKNPDEYLELQINKLLENLLNQKVAAELLRQKEGINVSE